jgi:pimeloyl-ACP methyl ester carboxylesterase
MAEPATIPRPHSHYTEAERIDVRGVSVAYRRKGDGEPTLYLHGAGFTRMWLPFYEQLSGHVDLICPEHPGYGETDMPDWLDGFEDLVIHYADLLDELGLERVHLAGYSLGGWIAAEIAIKSTARISHLVLANPIGIKVGGREQRDIADIFAISEDDFLKIAYCDPAAGKRDYKTMPDAEVRAAARNREATARYAWSPYMHDPKLKGRLHRIRIPTLFLWGTHDRVLSEDYGRAYCAAVPGARFEPIERAGHFPHIEQPNAFADKVFAFIGGDR